MTTAIAIEPVRRQIEVELPQAEAFALYSQEMVSWWPPEHSMNRKPFAEIVVEPRAGGRFYEVSNDGTTCDWGKVIAFDPPRSLTTSWHISGNWQVETDPAKFSEVEVTFTPLGDLATRIELVHRHIERHTAAEALAAGVGAPTGWTMNMERLRTEAARRATK